MPDLEPPCLPLGVLSKIDKYWWFANTRHLEAGEGTSSGWFDPYQIPTYSVAAPEHALVNTLGPWAVSTSRNFH